MTRHDGEISNVRDQAAASTRWRWLLGWVGPAFLGVSVAIIGIWHSSVWITVAAVVGATIGYFDPWNFKGRPR